MDNKNACGDDSCNGINSGIDKCISPLVDALNNAGLKTVASCCGHGNTLGNIALADGREIIIAPDFKTGREIHSKFPDIHGKYAKKGSNHPEKEQEEVMNYWTLYLGAFCMLVGGVLLQQPSVIAGAVTLAWIGIAVEN